MTDPVNPSRLEIAVRIFCSVLPRTSDMYQAETYRNGITEALKIADLFIEAAKPECKWCRLPLAAVCECGVTLCTWDHTSELDPETRHATKNVRWKCGSCQKNVCRDCSIKHISQHHKEKP